MAERGARTQDPGERGFGAVAVLALSMVLSALVAAVTVLAVSRTRSPRTPTTTLPLAERPGGSGGERASSNLRSERPPRETASDPSRAAVRVPDLVGVPLENVRTIVEALRFLLVVRIPREAGAWPDGTVSAQAPAAGTLLPIGSEVAVVVSAGPRTLDALSDGGLSSDAATDVVPVPSVRSLSLAAARARLFRAGLTEGPRRYRFDEFVSPGRVLHQSPEAGALVPRGAPVRLTINLE
jgi:hypothetical protein